MGHLLVGDNRTSGNWGGRAGSIALAALLREGFGEGESVYSSELLLSSSDYGYRSRLFPRSKAWVAREVAVSASRNCIVCGVRWLDQRLGPGDFLAADPARSVRNLLAWRGSDPGLQSLYDRVAAADIVIINGEGDVVFARPSRRQILFFAAVIRLARQLGKRVAFVNAQLSDCPLTGRNPEAFDVIAGALQECHFVSVRDPESRLIAQREMGLGEAAMIPDALFSWFDAQRDARTHLPSNGDFVIPPPEREELLGRLDFSRDYICVAGNSLASRPGHQEALSEGYRRLLVAIRSLGLPVYLVIADGPDRFLLELARQLELPVVPLETPIYFAAAILGRARLLVSGRYHPVIMGALGGTPSLLLSTGSHKMRSLARVLEHERLEVFPATPDAAAVRRLARAAAACLAAGSSLRARLQAVAEQRAAEARQLVRKIVAATDGTDATGARRPAAPAPARRSGRRAPVPARAGAKETTGA